nr:MAG TPA: DNA repair protein-like protein [Caudoviricetes sp.]
MHKRNDAHEVYVCPRDISFNTASEKNLVIS